MMVSALSAPLAGAVEVSATIDRSPVYIDETVNLVLTAEDSSPNTAAPDLEPLKGDFEVLSQSTQTNVSIMNNVPKVIKNWVIELQPRRLGVLEIPSLRIAGEQTLPIQLEVREFAGNQTTEGAEIFIEVEVSSTNPYVQSQVNFTARLFYSIPIVNGDLSAPDVPFATIEGPPLESRYSSNRGGIDYRVFERRYALFPDQSGSFSIPPIEFKSLIERIDPATNLRSHFRERFTSNAVRLEVRAIPRSYSGSTWLPAQDLQLLDSWNGQPPDFEFGRPESREISVDAVGLRAVQLPLAKFEESSTARIYGGNNSELNTSPTVDWIVSSRTDEFAIIPQNDWTVEVPEFEVVWWDVNEDREKVAVLPAILAPVGLSVDQQVNADLSSGAEPAVSELSEAANVDSMQTLFWKLISLTLLGMWILTVLLWCLNRQLRRNRMNAQLKSEELQHESERQVLRGIRKACKVGDAAEISRALLDWAAIRWQDRPPRNLIEIGRRMDCAALTAALEKLDRAVYSADRGACDGISIWTSLKKALDAEAPIRKKRRFRWFRSREQELEELWPV